MGRIRCFKHGLGGAAQLCEHLAAALLDGSSPQPYLHSSHVGNGEIYERIVCGDCLARLEAAAPFGSDQEVWDVFERVDSVVPHVPCCRVCASELLKRAPNPVAFDV